MAIFVATRIALLPPRARPADAAPSEFSAGRARAVLQRLVGSGIPHPAGSEENRRIRERVIEELQALGYAPEVQEAFACDAYGVCATVKNVLARLPGREEGRAVLLSAHYDSVAAGPGASDDGMGTSTLLEVARALKTEPPRRNDVLFLIDDGEESGLLGAEAFASGHPWASRVGVVINVEARGTEGPSLMFETSRDNRWLIAAFAGAVRRPITGSLFYSVSQRLPTDTDVTVFKEHGLSALNFANVGGVTRYHTPLDRFEYATPATLQHHGDNALALARELADEDLSSPPKGAAVFFDLFGRVIVWWPLWWTLPLAAIGAGLVVLATERLRRRRALSPAAWRWGAAAPIVALAAAALLGFLLLRAVRLAGALPTTWVAHPMPAVAAFWFVGLAVAGAVAWLLMPRARAEGLWAGGWCTWAALAAMVAALESSDSYPLLVPVLVTGTVALVLPSVAPLAGGIAAAILWFPIAWLLYDGVGVPILPVIAAVVAFASLPLMAEVVRAEAWDAWAPPAVAASAAVLATAVALSASPYSESSPERVTILLHQDETQARWLVLAEADLPDPMRSVASFDGPAPAFPWTPQAAAFSAPASVPAVALPELSVVHSESSGKGRRLRLHVASRRGAPVAGVLFPPDVAIEEVTMNGQRIGALRERAVRRAGGWHGYWCQTLPPKGIEIEVVLANPRPVVAWVVDQSRGLPDDRLLKARPKTAVPSSAGDVTLATRKVAL